MSDELDDYGWSPQMAKIWPIIEAFGEGTIDAAAKHFASPEIVRRTTPLTPEELKMLADDDERIFGNRVS